MYHSIIINGKNTWDDWHLIPTSLPVIAPPKERLIQVKVSGRDGKADLSHSLTGGPIFENREGSWSFYLDNDYWGTRITEAYGRGVAGPYTLRYLFEQELFGTDKAQKDRLCTVVLEDDPQFHYTGRVWLDQNLKQSDGLTTLTLKYSLYPYAAIPWDDKWLWDDFCFERDMALPKISDYKYGWLIGKGELLAASHQDRLTFPLPPSDLPYPVTLTVVDGTVDIILNVTFQDGSGMRYNRQTLWKKGEVFSVSDELTNGESRNIARGMLEVIPYEDSTVTLTAGEPRFL